MAPRDPNRPTGFTAPRREGALSPHAGTTGRRALVACTVLATVVVLVGVTLQARRSEDALALVAERTLHDYTGYAGRLMAREVLRRFSQQRARILAPVIGSSDRPVAPPTLDDIVRRGEHELASQGDDPWRGYFRIDLAGGPSDGRGFARGAVVARIADTVRVRAAVPDTAPELAIMALDVNGQRVSVAFASLRDRTGRPVAVYGYTYSRAIGVAYWAHVVFRDTPLLPSSFAGQRWTYDTTSVQPGEVLNDALLRIQITDRAGGVLWQSSTAPLSDLSIQERTVISTAAGDMNVETGLLAASAPTLVPAAVRRAQRWSLGAVIALALMLATVALLALRSERRVARWRRAEAMDQLALGLRHELNNALATVLLNAELLMETGDDDPAVREPLAAIAEQAARMRAVLRRLEQRERLDVIVPYLDEGYMVDLSTPQADPLTTEVPPAS